MEHKDLELATLDNAPLQNNLNAQPSRLWPRESSSFHRHACINQRQPGCQQASELWEVDNDIHIGVCLHTLLALRTKP